MKERPANSQITHGHPSCANYGCHKLECLQARRRIMKHRRYLAATGRPSITTTDRAAAHIAKLRAAGMPDATIRTASHVAPDPFYKAARPGGRIARTTEAKILSVPIPITTPSTAQKSTSLARIDGTSTRLRLQALVAIGWPRTRIAREMDSTGTLTHGTLSRLMLHLERDDVFVSLSAAIKAQQAYERMWNQNPITHGVTLYAAGRAKAQADAGGWRVPMDLDDDQLDDPANSRVLNISPPKRRAPKTFTQAA